jgi:hypothetical protein
VGPTEGMGAGDFLRTLSRKRRHRKNRPFVSHLPFFQCPGRNRRDGGEIQVKKKLAFEIFISGVVIFDMFGSYSYHLPIWPFFPMWVGAILEIEIGARLLNWLSKWVHLLKLLWFDSPPSRK